MDKKEQFDKLIELEKKYRFLYSGIEDSDIEDRYKIDKTIFPDWWFSSSDYGLKISLISKALLNQKLLLDLDEVNSLEKQRTSILLENNMNKRNV